MATDLFRAEVGDEAADWWGDLPEQEQIIAALQAYFVGDSDFDGDMLPLTDKESDILYVAEKPWKWAAEAHRLRQKLEREGDA